MLRADQAAIAVDDVVGLIGERAPRADVLTALQDLQDRAMVWGDAELRVSPEAADALPWFPGQVAAESPASPAADLSAAIDGLDEPARDVLRRLTIGSPVGRTRDAAPGAPADRPVARLLAAGLLQKLDAETVVLPRVVGQLLRGEEPGPADLTPPDPVVATTTGKDADAAAAGAAMELMRQVEVVLEALSATPVPELRSGGLGVRESKRLSKATGIDEPRLGLILELIAAAGLIARGFPDPPPPDDTVT